MKELYKGVKGPQEPLYVWKNWFSFSTEVALPANELQSAGCTKRIRSQDLDECGTECVVRLTVVNPQFEQPLTRAIDKLIGAGLRDDKFDFSNTIESGIRGT